MLPAAAEMSSILLAGEWRFALDAGDLGIAAGPDGWKFPDKIQLPGMLTAQGFGDIPSFETKWTGDGWRYPEMFKEWQTADNFKFPFFLQPPRHYVGPALYQRDRNPGGLERARAAGPSGTRSLAEPAVGGRRGGRFARLAGHATRLRFRPARAGQTHADPAHRQPAREKIDASHVVRHAGSSRSSVEARFRKTLGRSVKDEITRARIARSLVLLRETPMTLQQIAETCGFATASHFSRLFKESQEMTQGSLREGGRTLVEDDSNV